MWPATAQAVLALVVTLCIHRLRHVLARWIANIRLVRLFPHSENWSYMKGTFKQEPGVHWSEKFIKNFVEWPEKFKDTYSTFLGPAFFASVAVVHPEPLQAILKRADGKSSEYNLFKPWLGDGLLLSKGAKWQRNRKLLTPAFHFGILKTYISIYNEAADVLLAKLDENCRSGSEYWDVTKDINLATLDVILRSSFSFKTDCQVNADNDYVKAVTEISQLTVRRMISPFMRLDMVYSRTSDGRRAQRALATLHGHTRRIITARQAALASKQVELQDWQTGDEQGTKFLDFLDVLLTVRDPEGNPMPAEDIQAEVDTFLFEGHDTTTSALSWALYLLAKHPDHQTRVQHEIDSLVASKSREYIDWSDLPELKHLTLCIKEALRIYPPTPVIARRLDEDAELCGKTVAKGTVVDIVIYGLHHNRHVWGDDVEEFKPERFSLENTDKIHPYAYVPFSAGPRNCIGQSFAMNELKVVLARLLRRYTVKPHPSIQPRPAYVVVLRTAPGCPILLKLESRH